ncbi:MAG: endonuclease domain-containing protein [Bosea sp. (in: a-proteobacteria)]
MLSSPEEAEKSTSADSPNSNIDKIDHASKDKAHTFPSPLAGEGGSARSDETDEGAGKGLPQPVTAKGRARAMRRNMTEAERKLWYLLRGRRFSGFKFRRQVPIGRYIVDFMCFEAKLVVEADGSQHAESQPDVVRDAWLSAAGFKVRRFWNADIFLRSSEVVDTIWHDLNPTLLSSGQTS